MTSSKEREPRCSCGSLRATTMGEPARIVACHCTQCQRRTGSPMGVIAYFPRAQVRPDGAANAFTRDAPEDRKFISARNAAARSMSSATSRPT